MTPARARVLPVITLVIGMIGWLLLDAWTGAGNEAPPLPWTAILGILVLAGIVVAAGRQVRRSVQGRRPEPVDALTAARIAVLSKAAAYGGAALAGWYLAQAATLLPALVGERVDRLVVAVAAAVAAALLAGAGLLAQSWCRVPPGPTEQRDRPERDDPEEPDEQVRPAGGR